MPPRSSASTMYAINNIGSFELLIRKRLFGFTERLNNCEHTLIKCINNSGVLRFGAHGMKAIINIVTIDCHALYINFLCNVPLYFTTVIHVLSMGLLDPK